MKHNRNKGILILSDDEMKEFVKNGVVTVNRKGFDILVENIDGHITINIVNPYETIKSRSNFY